MRKKPQIVFIHGGSTFSSRKSFQEHLKSLPLSFEKPKKKWNKDYFDKKLKHHGEIIRPQMPLKENAHYEEWKIHFEKFLEYLRDNVILVGFSLGGIFLARYLAENTLPVKIKNVYLIASPFDNSLPEEELVNGFTLPKDLSQLDALKPTLLFSSTDEIVPISHKDKFKKKLPLATIISYDDKTNHFFDEKFPELITMIKKDLKQ